jgi:hypothetical protein
VTVNTADRVAFLKRIHLFRGLDDDQLAGVAAKISEKPYQAGELVVKQGDSAHSLFMIFRGNARVMHKEKKKDQQQSVLVPDDYFGEETLIPKGYYSTSIYAQTDALLLVLSRRDLDKLLQQVSILKPNFEVAISSRRLARKLQFGWLEPGEVIYFLSRKHPILLWEAMILPTLAFILPIGLMVGHLLSKVQPIFYLAIAAFVLNIAWIIWRALDWGNDYYIVTNLRVIWLEKVIALYDSRQEAPLSTILAVGVETDQVGRILGYGDVIVRTFVGRIPFYHVSNPYQAASLIDEQWIRVKNVTRRTDVDALKRSIRQKLGLPVTEEVKSSASSPAPKVVTNKVLKLKDILDRLNIFKVRFEDKAGTITYRKHWIVLFFQTWLPAALFILALVLTVYRSTHLPEPPVGGPTPRTDPFLTIMIIVLIGAFFWWVYQYWDWTNDIFRVTADQIFDIDRKPLGREEKRSAPLDNILSTESDRRGLLQILFNYGNVYISVGKTQMDFSDVYNPSGVQQDIDNRRMACIERKNQAEALVERERLAEFFAMYHETSGAFRSDQEAHRVTQNLKPPDQTEEE